MGFWPFSKQASGDSRPNPGPGDDFWYGPTPHTTGAGISVTPDVAIKSAAVYACCSKIAKIMASMPLVLYADKGSKGQSEASEHPLSDVIRYHPNDTYTAFDFWFAMIWLALTRGVAYAEKEIDAKGQVRKLHPLHPDYVKPVSLGRDRWRFDVRDAHGGVRPLLSDEVFRFSGLVSTGVAGFGICDHAGETIAISMAADQYAARVFSNAINAGFVLKHPNKLSPEAQNNLLGALAKRFAGPANAHRPLILQEGMEATKLGQTAQEAQIIEGRRFQMLQICQALDMPPIMVGIAEGAVQANVEEQSLNFVRYTLQPWAKKIEQACRRDLIVPDYETNRRSYKVEFNFGALLRGNAAARAQYFSAALGSGGSPAWLSVDEVRIIEGFNPIGKPGYDEPALGINPISPAQGQDSSGDSSNDEDSDEEAKKGGEDSAPSARKRTTLRLPQRQPKALAADDSTDSPARRVGRLITREVSALRRYVAAHAGDRPKIERAITEFYRSQVAFVASTMGVPKDKARLYCLARADRFCRADDIVALIDKLEADGSAELLGV